MSPDMFLRTATALQSAKFAMAMEKHAKIVDPELNIHIYGVEELSEVQKTPEFQSRSFKMPMRYLDLPETSKILTTQEGAASVRQYKKDNRMEAFLSVKTEEKNPKTLFDIIYDEKHMPEATMLDTEEPLFDVAKFKTNHEIFHASLRRMTKEKVGTLTLTESANYQKFLHEGGADLFAVLDEIHDGGDPEKVISTIALSRSLNTLKRGDHKHFTTPVLQAYEQDIIENVDAIRDKPKSELLNETVSMVIGSMENPEDLTEGSLFSEMEYENFTALMREAKECLGEQQGGIPIKDKFEYTPIDLVNIAKTADNDALREYVDGYIEPYAHVLEPEMEMEQDISTLEY